MASPPWGLCQQACRLQLHLRRLPAAVQLPYSLSFPFCVCMKKAIWPAGRAATPVFRRRHSHGDLRHRTYQEQVAWNLPSLLRFQCRERRQGCVEWHQVHHWSRSVTVDHLHLPRVQHNQKYLFWDVLATRNGVISVTAVQRAAACMSGISCVFRHIKPFNARLCGAIVAHSKTRRRTHRHHVSQETSHPSVVCATDLTGPIKWDSYVGCWQTERPCLVPGQNSRNGFSIASRAAHGGSHPQAWIAIEWNTRDHQILAAIPGDPAWQAEWELLAVLIASTHVDCAPPGQVCRGLSNRRHRSAVQHQKLVPSLPRSPYDRKLSNITFTLEHMSSVLNVECRLTAIPRSSHKERSPAFLPSSGHGRRTSTQPISKSERHPGTLGRAAFARRRTAELTGAQRRRRVLLRHHRHRHLSAQLRRTPAFTCSTMWPTRKAEDCTSVSQELCRMALGTSSPTAELIYAASSGISRGSQFSARCGSFELYSVGFGTSFLSCDLTYVRIPSLCPRNASPAAQWSTSEEDVNRFPTHTSHGVDVTTPGFFSLRHLQTAGRQLATNFWQGMTAPSARGSSASLWATWRTFHSTWFGETTPVLRFVTGINPGSFGFVRSRQVQVLPSMCVQGEGDATSGTDTSGAKATRWPTFRSSGEHVLLATVLPFARQGSRGRTRHPRHPRSPARVDPPSRCGCRVCHAKD